MSRPGARIVLIHRYFHPDTPPYASILSGIAEALADAGFDVEVIAGQPSYNRSVVRGAPRRESPRAGLTIRRVRVLDDRRSALLKLLNLAWFSLAVLAIGARLGPVRAVMAASTPPLIVARAASWLARLKGAAFVYHHQDIYPEILDGWQRRAPLRLLRRVDATTDRRAARIVVLSADMHRTIAARGVAEDRIVTINNFDPWPEPAHAPGGAGGGERLAVVYAGNLGRFQNLQTVIAAAGLLADAPVDFHVVGDGPVRAELVAAARDAGLRSVRFHGFMPPEELAAFLETTADIGLVTLHDHVVRAAYPSKTMSYLRHGVPVLALVEGDSELAASLRAAGAGVSVDPSAGAAALAEALGRLIERHGELAAAGRAARELYREEFERAGALARWVAMFGTVTAGERR